MEGDRRNVHDCPPARRRNALATRGRSRAPTPMARRRVKHPASPLTGHFLWRRPREFLQPPGGGG